MLNLGETQYPRSLTFCKGTGMKMLFPNKDFVKATQVFYKEFEEHEIITSCETAVEIVY